MAINNLSNPLEIEEYNRRHKKRLLQLMTPGEKANAARGQMAMQSPRLDSNINMPLSAKQQLAIQATQNADIPGMDQILGAKTTTFGTALAKTLAAGASSYYGRKDNAEKASVLTKALQAKENAIGAEERAALDVDLQERLKNEASEVAAIEESAKRFGIKQENERKKIEADQAKLGKPMAVFNTKTGAEIIVYPQNGQLVTKNESGTVQPFNLTPEYSLNQTSRSSKTIYSPDGSPTIVNEDQQGNLSTRDDSGNFVPYIPPPGSSTNKPRVQKQVPAAIRKQAIQAEALIKDLTQYKDAIFAYRGDKGTPDNLSDDLLPNGVFRDDSFLAYKETVPELLKKVLPSGAIRSVENQMRGPEIISLIDRGRQLSSAVIHDKYGAAFSGGEQGRADQWDFSATGIGDEQAIERINNLIREAQNKIDASMADYGGQGRLSGEIKDDINEELEEILKRNLANGN
jgi:hypothetical protein